MSPATPRHKVETLGRYGGDGTGTCLLQEIISVQAISPVAKAGCSLHIVRELTTLILGSINNSKALAKLMRQFKWPLFYSSEAKQCNLGKVSCLFNHSLYFEKGCRCLTAQLMQLTSHLSKAHIISQTSEAQGTLLFDRWGNWCPERFLHTTREFITHTTTTKTRHMWPRCSDSPALGINRWAAGPWLGTESQLLGNVESAFSAAS